MFPKNRQCFRKNKLIFQKLTWFFNLGNGDLWDGYWYNNPDAVGTQLYPRGLNKYFDKRENDT